MNEELNKSNNWDKCTDVMALILADYTTQPADEIKQILTDIWDCEQIEIYLDDNFGPASEICMSVFWHYVG